MVVLELLGVIALATAAFAFAHLAKPRWSLPVFVLLGIVVGLDAVAIATDYRDADGIFDCWPHCSGLQNFVRMSLPLGAIALAAGMVGGATRRR